MVERHNLYPNTYTLKCISLIGQLHNAINGDATLDYNIF